MDPTENTGLAPINESGAPPTHSNEPMASHHETTPSQFEFAQPSTHMDEANTEHPPEYYGDPLAKQNQVCIIVKINRFPVKYNWLAA